MKKIRSKHNNLLNYFLFDSRELSPGYVRECEKFLKKIRLKYNKILDKRSLNELNYLQMNSELSRKLQAASNKRQAASNKRLTK
jgi:hypothetical protein|tara:strand:+ start:31 stop:282 length:252 start_codon:yes stop_codon:yes gene_type:complete